MEEIIPKPPQIHIPDISESNCNLFVAIQDKEVEILFQSPGLACKLYGLTEGKNKLSVPTPVGYSASEILGMYKLTSLKKVNLPIVLRKIPGSPYYGMTSISGKDCGVCRIEKLD